MLQSFSRRCFMQVKGHFSLYTVCILLISPLFESAKYPGWHFLGICCSIISTFFCSFPANTERHGMCCTPVTMHIVTRGSQSCNHPYQLLFAHSSTYCTANMLPNHPWKHPNKTFSLPRLQICRLMYSFLWMFWDTF